MPRPSRPRLATAAFAALLLIAAAAPAYAYERRGERADVPLTYPRKRWLLQDVTGYFFAGVFLYGSRFPARPDNTGNALLRLGEHFDIDVIGRYLSIAYDANLVWDRDSAGASAYESTLALHGFIPLPRGFGVRLGGHYATALPINGPRSYSLSSIEATARVEYNGRRARASLGIGAVPWADPLPARPDNTGTALLRATATLDVRASRWISARAYARVTTDGERPGIDVVRPAALDATAEIALHVRPSIELALAGGVELALDDPTAAQTASARDVGLTGGEPAPRAHTALYLRVPFDLRAW